MSDISYLASELVRLGTQSVFGIPGEGSSLELLVELERLGCSFYLAPHEAAGALMAGGYGRVSQVPGISLSIKGPGLSNMLPGIVTNWLDHNPAISLSESYGPGSNPHRAHKRLAHYSMLAQTVKAYADNVSPSLVETLWNLSLAEELGPVHLDISGCLNRSSFQTHELNVDRPTGISAEAARLIAKAQKPVVIAGALAGRRRWGEKLKNLRIPTFTTVAGKGVIDETTRYAGGIFTNSGGPLSPERNVLPVADLIVGLGLRATELIDVRPLPAPLILFDELPGKADGLRAQFEVGVAFEEIPQALELLSSKEWGAEEIARAVAALQMSLDGDGWLPAAALAVAQKILPSPTRFVLDTGNFCTVAEHVLLAKSPLSVMGSSCARSMGVSLPMGVGAALAAPDIPLVTVIGDGGIGMYPEVIRVAVTEKLPQLILLMKDGFLSSIRKEAVKEDSAGRFLRIPCASWTGLFKSFGCLAERVESLTALEDALQLWRAESGPLFLELLFEPDAYMHMTDGIR